MLVFAYWLAFWFCSTCTGPCYVSIIQVTMYKGIYRFSNTIPSSTLLALYRRPKFFKALFLITVKCSFQVRCSSVNNSKYLIEVVCFISLSFINNDGSFNGMLSFPQTLWKSVYHFKTLFISNLAVWKSFLFLCEKKRFVSSANIMGSDILDTLQNHLYILWKEVALRLIFDAVHR